MNKEDTAVAQLCFGVVGLLMMAVFPAEAAKNAGMIISALVIVYAIVRSIYVAYRKRKENVD